MISKGGMSRGGISNEGPARGPSSPAGEVSRERSSTEGAANPQSASPASPRRDASGKPSGAGGAGLEIRRLFTAGEREPLDPYETVEWERRTCRILNSDGSVVFEADDVEIPRSWSTIAGDIMASKYMRKAGVPLYDEDGNPLLDRDGSQVTGRERSTRQVVRRLVSCWRHWGDRYGYFASPRDAASFEDEMAYMLLHQMAAPNSPQWFNTGLHHVYGISGPSQGHYYVDPETEEVRVSRDAYSRPQPHACFIQSVKDDLVNVGGIMDLWMREARLFKYGSGTGTNFSAIRGEGEPLAGGGFSSGLMSFLKIGDRAAGAIKSGGTTRRAAKMVCLDLDHPDIESFINWKAEEEKKAKMLVSAGYDADFNGEAYATVSGQNSNNSVRVPNDFLRALEEDGEWELRWRTDGRVSRRVRARRIWDQICEAAWQCADPGVQFDTTINDWHTCPASGRINASNPCSEYMFLDDTACNLASINLVKFYDAKEQAFDVEAFRHACRLWTAVLEISVLMAQYPSPEIADLSYRFRTLGLGYANLGTLLMISGIPYDSEEGRAICGAITALMTAESYATSAEMAKHLGPFPAFGENRDHTLRVMRNHRRAAYGAPAEEYESLSVIPQAIDSSVCPPYLLQAAREGWDRAVDLGERFGLRNAQATVIAPTGTIGLLMDCDTTGIEPDFSLVKFKKLAGGGYFKIPNRSVVLALAGLGYDDAETKRIIEYMVGTATLDRPGGEGSGSGGIDRQALLAKGLREDELEAVESALPKVFEVGSAFSRWTLGDACLERLGIEPEVYQAPDFNLLARLGFTPAEISEANERICGRHTVEGAPGIREEHLAVFDCANRCGKTGTRFIAPQGHLRMMAAAQPFISGALSKTINMPNETTVEEISGAYLLSWKLGLKATALYRDGCKASQPLSTRADSDRGDRSSGESGETDAAESQSELRAPAGEGAPPSPLPRQRRPLPAKRRGFTQEAKVGGHKLYLRTGEYEDGTLGEIFIDMHKEGAAFRAIMNCFAIAVSKGLQYGVPLEEFVDTFTFTRFAPQGQVQGHPNIKMATSIVDYVFRVLGLEYLSRTDFVHVKPEDIGEGDPGEKLLSETEKKRARKKRASRDERAGGRAEPGSGERASGGSSGGATSRAPGGAGERGGSGGAAPREAGGSSGARESRSTGGSPEARDAQADERRPGNGSSAMTEPLEASGRFAAANRLPAAARPEAVDEADVPGSLQSYDAELEELMGDAPPCERCGHTTIRSGSCYRCLVCGESMGCS